MVLIVASTVDLRLANHLSLSGFFRQIPERLTVISGTFNIGMGDKFDASKTTAMPPGSFGTWEAGMKHYVWAKGETIVQLHGTGPWMIEYVNPADDPRKKK